MSRGAAVHAFLMALWIKKRMASGSQHVLSVVKIIEKAKGDGELNY
jgi:hypothetical protein